MKNLKALFRKEINALSPFTAEKSIESIKKKIGLDEVARLGYNENPLGPSSIVLTAMEKALKKTNYYPDSTSLELRIKMAKRVGIDEDMVVFSNGGDNCLFLISCAFINPGDEIIMADQTFSVYRKNTIIMGGLPVLVPLKNYHHDLKTMAEKITPKTKLIYICNPNNPHGTIIKRKELEKFLQQIPEHVIVILDEAYCEFVADKNYPNGLDYVIEGNNVIVLRTFSKLYGLAGLRVGYLLGSRDLILGINTVKEAFSLSRIAQAGALAALNDEKHKELTLKCISEGKSYLYEAFDKMKVDYIPSHTNFIYFDLKIDTEEMCTTLLNQGVFIRPGKLLGSNTCARVTIGSLKENQKFIATLQQFID